MNCQHKAPLHYGDYIMKLEKISEQPLSNSFKNLLILICKELLSIYEFGIQKTNNQNLRFHTDH